MVLLGLLGIEADEDVDDVVDDEDDALWEKERGVLVPRVNESIRLRLTKSVYEEESSRSLSFCHVCVAISRSVDVKGDATDQTHRPLAALTALSALIIDVLIAVRPA